ncbi:MAG TPA: tetratricopeptide repeat protein, partial [Caulobacteraceae bacterium]
MGVNPGTGALDAVTQFDRAVAMMNLGRWPEALAGYEAVLRLAPEHLPSLNNRGIVLARMDRHADALACYEAALAVAPDDPFALNNRGETLQKLMRPQEALASYDAALARAPDFAEAHGNRGHLLAQLGRTDEAVEALQRAIELQPAKPRFYQHLAPLRRFAPGDPVLARMQRLAAQAGALSAEASIELGFALAKALADTGESERAFEQLSLANRLKRSTLHYDEQAALGELERIGALFGEDFQARMQDAGDPEPMPILIVGMPRSGSTLVEQILASHPKVFGAGENADLDEAVGETLLREGLDPFPDGAARLSPEAVRALGEAYMRRLRGASPDAERIVDKTLSNRRFLGLVHAALPSARFVHVRRDPLDTCMSCFGLLFGGYQPFAYDLGELGRYHRAVDLLMRRWRDLLPAGVLLELQYEALIADPEGQVRRLLEHCGLDWDPRCLQFHRSERFVRTSSAAQVRRPLYADAVGASRVHERHLGPLLEALGAERQAPSPVRRGVVGERGSPAESRPMSVTDLERKAGSGDVGAQRTLAETLDAAGRHTEAIDWLARAGNAGDVEALTRLGVRLVSGKDAPFLPLDGARLLGNAAQGGGAEAMERLAVLIGAGFFARQSWPAALDLLTRAAGKGSASAQTQLSLLAGAGLPSGQGAAAGVDIGAWTAAPEPRVLLASPRLLTVEQLVPAPVCDWIVGQATDRLVRAELYD